MGYVSFFENFVQIIFLLFAWIVALLAFFILAIQIFVTLIEFKLTTPVFRATLPVSRAKPRRSGRRCPAISAGRWFQPQLSLVRRRLIRSSSVAPRRRRRLA
jgi:hypothetical protein